MDSPAIRALGNRILLLAPKPSPDLLALPPFDVPAVCGVWDVGQPPLNVGREHPLEMRCPFHIKLSTVLLPTLEQNKKHGLKLVLYHRNHKHLRFETFEVRICENHAF